MTARAERRGRGPALVIAVVLLWQIAGAGAIMRIVEKLVQRAPWCRAAPNCWVPKELQAAGMHLITHPEPASEADWPDVRILQQCRYIAYCPYGDDGVGSQYARLGKIIAYARHYGLEFLHVPLESYGPTHLDVDGSSVDAFFNFGAGAASLSDLAPNTTVCLVDFCDPPVPMRQIRSLLIPKIQAGSLRTAATLPDFASDAVHVAVHVRRGDLKDYPDPRRWLPNSYYVSVVRDLQQGLLRGLAYKFHLFSEGVRAEFADIIAVDPANTILHLNEDVTLTMQGALCTDVFLKAPSTFSGLLGSMLHTGIVIQPRQRVDDALLSFLRVENFVSCIRASSMTDCARDLLRQRMAGRMWRPYC